MLSCMYKYNILKRFIAEDLILLNMQKITYCCATKAILITQSLYNNFVLK